MQSRFRRSAHGASVVAVLAGTDRYLSYVEIGKLANRSAGQVSEDVADLRRGGRIEERDEYASELKARVGPDWNVGHARRMVRLTLDDPARVMRVAA
jgi:hypothetical protein